MSFTFSSTPAAKGSFSFQPGSSQGSTPAQGGGFSFQQPATAPPAAESKPAFSFGQPPATGAKPTPTSTAPSTGFSFGNNTATSTPTTQPAQPTGGFSFAKPASTTPAPAESKPSTSTFSFGTPSTTTPAESKPSSASTSFSFTPGGGGGGETKAPDAGSKPAFSFTPSADSATKSASPAKPQGFSLAPPAADKPESKPVAFTLPQSTPPASDKAPLTPKADTKAEKPESKGSGFSFNATPTDTKATAGGFGFNTGGGGSTASPLAPGGFNLSGSKPPAVAEPKKNALDEESKDWPDHMLATNERVLSFLLGATGSNITELLEPSSAVVKRLKSLFSYYQPSSKESLTQLEKEELPYFEGCKSKCRPQPMEIEFAKRLSESLPTAAKPTGAAKICWTAGGLNEVQSWQLFRSFLRQHFSLSSVMEVHFNDNWLNDVREFVWRERIDMIRLLIAVEMNASDELSVHQELCERCMDALGPAAHTTLVVDHIEAASTLLQSYVSEGSTTRPTQQSRVMRRSQPSRVDPSQGPWILQLMSEITVMLELLILRYYARPTLADRSQFRRVFDLMIKNKFYAFHHADFPYLGEGTILQKRADSQLQDLHQRSILIFFSMFRFIHFFSSSDTPHPLLEGMGSLNSANAIAELRNIHSHVTYVADQELEPSKAKNAKLLVIVGWCVFTTLSMRTLNDDAFEDAIKQGGDVDQVLGNAVSLGAFDALEQCAAHLSSRRPLTFSTPLQRLRNLVRMPTSKLGAELMLDVTDSEDGIFAVETATHATIVLEFLASLVDIASPQDQDTETLCILSRSSDYALDAHPGVSRLFWQRWARCVETGGFGSGLNTFADPLVILLHTILSTQTLRLLAAYGVVGSLVKTPQDADLAFYILYERNLWSEVAQTFTNLQINPYSPPSSFLACASLLCGICTHMTDAVVALEKALPDLDLRVVPNTCVRFVCLFHSVSHHQTTPDTTAWKALVSCCDILRMLIIRSDSSFNRVVMEEILDASGPLYGSVTFSAALHRLGSVENVPESHRIELLNSVMELTRAVVRHTTSPVGSADLHILFNRFDTDGNKTLDKSEFANGLAAMGYRLSRTAINQLFRQFDSSGEGDNAIDYDEFVQFALSSQHQSNLAERAQDYARAPTVEAELRQLMQSLMRPDASRVLREVELCAQLCSTAASTLSMSALRRWSPAEKPAVLLSVLRIFKQLLHSDVTDLHQQSQDATSALTALRSQVVVRFIEDGDVKTAFLSALGSLNSNVLTRKSARSSIYARASHQTMTVSQLIHRGGLSAESAVSSSAPPSHLPFDFSSGLRVTGSVETTEAQKSTMEAVVEESLLLLIELYVRVMDPAYFDVSLVLSLVNMMSLPVDMDRGSSGSAGVSPSTPFNYLMVIASLMDYPEVPGLRNPHPIPLLALKALDAFSRALGALATIAETGECPGLKVHSFLEFLGIENLEPFKTSLHDLLVTPGELSSVKGAALELLANLVDDHPVFAKMLLCELNTDILIDDGKEPTAPVVPEHASYKLGDGSVLSALSKGVLHREALDHDPWLLSTALRFVHSLWGHRGRGRLYLGAIALASSSTFWEVLGRPLMVDLGSPPPFDVREISSFTNDRELKPRFGDERSSMSQFCSRVLCRAYSLQILAIEQHEHFQHEKGSRRLPNGVEAANHMRVWLKQAQETSRPREWLDQYLTFNLDPNLLTSLLFQSREVGYDLSAYRVPTHLTRFGENFIFNINALRLSMGNTTSESKLLEATAAANHALSLADVQEKLIAAWKRFMESWVASAAKLKVSKSKNRSASSPDRSPSVDSPTSSDPGTPASIMTGTNKPSEFKGDLRSFTVSKKVSVLLANEFPSLDGISNVGKLGVVLTELSEVLTSMLYHQLFVVKERHSDPLSSKAEMRLDSRLEKLENIDHCFRILGNVNKACSKYFAGSASSLPSLRTSGEALRLLHPDLEFFIQLRLNILTSALLLVLILTSVAEKMDMEAGEDGQKRDRFPASQEEFQKIFQHAVESIQWASEVIKITEQKEQKEVSPTVKTLAHLQSVCECLLTTLLTDETSAANRWKSTNLIKCIFAHLSSTSTDAAHEYAQVHDIRYLSAALHQRRMSRKRGAAAASTAPLDEKQNPALRKRLSPSTAAPRGAARMNALIVFLQSISQKPDLTTNMLAEGLIPVLTSDPLLSVMLKESQQVSHEYCHILGYVANGNKSPAHECWQSVLRFMTLLVTSNVHQNHADSSHSTLHEASLRTATQFISHFRALIEAPLKCFGRNDKGEREARVTQVQLGEAGTTLRFLAAMASDISTWRAFAPDQPDYFQRLALQCVCDWIILLGDGSSQENQKESTDLYERYESSLLYRCADEISAKERKSKNKKRTQKNIAKLQKASRLMTMLRSTSAQDAAPSTPNKPRTLDLSTITPTSHGKPPTSRSVSKESAFSATTSAAADDDSEDPENFFKLVEQSLVTAVQHGLTFLRILSPLSPPTRTSSCASKLPNWLCLGDVTSIRRFGIPAGVFVRTISVPSTPEEEPRINRWCILGEQKQWNDGVGGWDATYTAVSEDLQTFAEVQASHIYLIERTERGSVWFNYTMVGDIPIKMFQAGPSVHHIVQLIRYLNTRLRSGELSEDEHDEMVILAETAVWTLVANVEAFGRVKEIEKVEKFLRFGANSQPPLTAEEKKLQAKEQDVDAYILSVFDDLLGQPTNGIVSYLQSHTPEGEEDVLGELITSSTELMRRLQGAKGRGVAPKEKRQSFGGKNPLLLDF